MFELNQKYTFKIEGNGITVSGMNAIQSFLAQQGLPELPFFWTWQWVVSGKAEYVGKFPVRVSKYYHKAHGIQCADAFLSALGNLARAHTEADAVYTFEFVNRFDWQDGDFGDDGSCYWGDNAGALVMLEDNGALAIRFYDEDGRGMGRAWVVEIGSSLYIIFNGYGLPGDSTLHITRVFAAFTGLQYQFIGVTNHAGYTLYINNGGYLIGKADVIGGFRSTYDLGWDDVHIDRCHECGNALAEYEIYYGADDLSYCENCYSDLFDHCESCYETRYAHDVVYVASAKMYICRICRARDYDRCVRCNEWFEKHRLYRHEGELHCWNCLNDVTWP